MFNYLISIVSHSYQLPLDAVSCHTGCVQSVDMLSAHMQLCTQKGPTVIVCAELEVNVVELEEVQVLAKFLLLKQTFSFHYEEVVCVCVFCVYSPSTVTHCPT